MKSTIQSLAALTCSAIHSWPTTLRLCLIVVVVMGVPAAALTVLVGHQHLSAVPTAIAAAMVISRRRLR